MNYIFLLVAVLTLGSWHGALGIICQKCTPDVQKFTACDKPDQLVEVDCDNETFPFNVTEGTKYDSCATTTIGVNLGAQSLTSFVMSCAVKVNSSNPSVVNCSLIQDYVCGDARRRASESTGITYSITSCSSVCCTEKSCNVHPTTAPSDNKANGDSSTATSTTVDGNGVSEVQPPCLGLLLVMLAISVAMKKVDEYF